MFAGKAAAYPSEAPGLTHTHYTRLERLRRDKHSCLLRKFVNYGRKKFYKIETRLVDVLMLSGDVMTPSLMYCDVLH